MNGVISMNNLPGIYPDLVVLLGAFAVLALELLWPQKGSKTRVLYVSMAVLGLGLLGLGARSWGMPQEVFPGFLRVDGLSGMAKFILLGIGILTLAAGKSGSRNLGLDHAEYYALLLFALFGMMQLCGSVNFLGTFVDLETFSLAMYVLAGFNKRLAGNREAALKYFLPGAFAAAFFLFGLALVFGATGSVRYQDFVTAWQSPALREAQRALMLAGLGLMLAAFAFKVGLVPFHFWVPDVYEGASTPVSAFLSAGAKVAGMVALLRLVGLVADPLDFFQAGPSSYALGRVLLLLSVLTMMVGNLAALRQKSVKRMLAYSSVAHSGYALVGLVAVLGGHSPDGASALMAYVLVYVLMNFAAFGLVAALEAGWPQALLGRPPMLEDFNGLGFAKPVFGAALALAMFSMAGLPPTAGFTAKFFLFKSAVEAGQVGLVVVAVLNSVLSAAYYLRLVVHLYMRPAAREAGLPLFEGWGAWMTVFCALLLLFWGLLPQSLINLSQAATMGIWH